MSISRSSVSCSAAWSAFGWKQKWIFLFCFIDVLIIWIDDAVDGVKKSKYKGMSEKMKNSLLGVTCPSGQYVGAPYLKLLVVIMKVSTGPCRINCSYFRMWMKHIYIHLVSTVTLHLHVAAFVYYMYVWQIHVETACILNVASFTTVQLFGLVATVRPFLTKVSSKTGSRGAASLALWHDITVHSRNSLTSYKTYNMSLLLLGFCTD